MYFSDFNKNITYETTWGEGLKVCGRGKVQKEDTRVSPGSIKDLIQYSCITRDKGITEVGAGFLETFVKLDCLVINRSVRKIAQSAELKALLKRNNVLIRGWKNTYADSFARENGLAFLQADIELGWSHSEYTNTKLSLCFRRKGGPYLEFEDFCSGISAGNNGGGTYTRELGKGYFSGMTPKEFAELYPYFSAGILKNDDFAWFLKNQ